MSKTTLHRVGTRALLRALGTGEPKPAQLLILLALNLGRVVEPYTIIDFLYGAAEDGGADSAENAIAVWVVRLREAGFNIRTEWGVGYALVASSNSRRYTLGDVRRYIEQGDWYKPSANNALPLGLRKHLILRYRSGEGIADIAEDTGVSKPTILKLARSKKLRRRRQYTVADRTRIIDRVRGGERFQHVVDSEPVDENALQKWLTAADVSRLNPLWFDQDKRHRLLERVRRGDRPYLIEAEEGVSKRALYRLRRDAGLISARVPGSYRR